jgi:hypothetical protein
MTVGPSMGPTDLDCRLFHSPDLETLILTTDFYI